MFSAIWIRLTQGELSDVHCEMSAQGISGAWHSACSLPLAEIQQRLAECVAWIEQEHEPGEAIDFSFAQAQLRLESLPSTWEARCRVTAVEKGSLRLALTHITACEMGISDLREALGSLTKIVSQQTVEAVLGADLDPIQVHDGQGPSVVFRVDEDGRHFLLPTLGEAGGNRFLPADPGLDYEAWAEELEQLREAVLASGAEQSSETVPAGVWQSLPEFQQPPQWSMSWTGTHPLGFEARLYCGLWECGTLITLTHRFASLSQPTPFAQFYCSAADLGASVAELRKGQCVLYGRPAPWSPATQKDEEQ